jgi:uncharacterized protein
MTPPRLLPDLPLPAYPFVPGQSPHPYSDPQGHRYCPPLPAAAPLHDRRDSPHYLLGIDLFNQGFYWEAHEMWERLWHACGRRGPTADFLKALIKLAAAGVKHREGKPQGVHSHAERVGSLLRALRTAHEILFGLSLDGLLQRADEIASTGWPLTPPYLMLDNGPVVLC